MISMAWDSGCTGDERATHVALPVAPAPAPPLAGALASAAFAPFCLAGCGASGCLVCMSKREA